MITEKEFRLRRAYEDWTQTKLAMELGITQEHLSRVERGTEPISKKLEKRYIKLFGKKLLIDKLNETDLATHKRGLRIILRDTYNQRDDAIDGLFKTWDAVRERSLRKQKVEKKGGDLE